MTDTRRRLVVWLERLRAFERSHAEEEARQRSLGAWSMADYHARERGYYQRRIEQAERLLEDAQAEMEVMG